MPDDEGGIYTHSIAIVDNEMDDLQKRWKAIASQASSSSIKDTRNTQMEKLIGDSLIGIFTAIKDLNEKMTTLVNERLVGLETSVRALQQAPPPPELSELRIEVADLKQEVKAEVADLKKELTELREESRLHKETADQADEAHQRSMKGNLLIYSPELAAKNGKPERASLLKSADDLRRENTSLFEHAVDLIEQKTSVTISQQDVQACHWVRDGVILRFWNRNRGSSWEKVTKAMKVHKKPDVNIHLNFQLTPRRSQFFSDVRKLRVDGHIRGCSVDCNGRVWVRPTEGLWFKKIPSWNLTAHTDPKGRLAVLKDKLSQFRAENPKWPVFVKKDK